MRFASFATACILCVAPAALAQSHTIVALSHSDNTACEVDPATGRILNEFTAVNQPHEGVASPDGKTFHAAIPNGPHVVIDLKTMTVAARHKVGVNPFGGGLRLTTRP
jgi:hypothetical protein